MTDYTPPLEAPTDGPPPGSAPAEPPTRRPVRWGALVFDALLVALLCVGVYFRFDWRNWSQDTDLHPDEYGLTSTLTRLKMPSSLDEYFNTRLSPISPYPQYDEFGNKVADGPDNRMRWGQWPIILLKWGAEVTDNVGYREQRLFGRSFSALADTLALLVIFLIGARLYHWRVGLLAAALSSLAVMQIQQAHFMTSDTFGVLFTALAMYCAVEATLARPGRSRLPEWAWYILFGVFFGMGVASRVNLAPLAGMILIAALIAHFDELGTAHDYSRVLGRIAALVALAGVVSVLTFRVTHPMAFRAETGDTTVFTITPNKDWLDSLAVAQAESDGLGGGPPGEQWTNRPALVFPWINMVVWGMGLPLGLFAWAGLAWAGWRVLTSDWRTRFATHVAPHLLPAVWVGGYFLFMGTRWVKSVRYFLPIYPFLALLAAWALLELWRKASGDASPLTDEARRRRSFQPSSLVFRLGAAALFAVVLGGTLAWAWGFTSIYRTDNTRIQASHWIYQNVPGPFNLKIDLPPEAGGGTYTDPVPFPDAQLVADVAYRVEVRPHVSGTLTGLTVAHVRNLYDASLTGTLKVVIANDPDGQQVVAEAPVSPVLLEKDHTYYLLVSAPEGGPLQVTGSVVSNESWDEGVPLRIEGRDAFGGLYRGLTMEVRWFDDENKRQMFLTNLAQVDYIFLPSQRAIWSASRLPNTYPMTMEYYRALFDGRLGFELAAEFQSPITIGPLQVSDVAGTWAWGARPDLTPDANDPFNNHALAAEEAFSVYDHAPVWVFRKRPDFSLDKASQVLNAIDLSKAINQGPRAATLAPTLLMLPPDLLAIQRAGGTWREMFNPAGLLNASQPLAVVVWYLTMLVMGVLAFPFTAAAFGGLPDRGYALAKTVALLFVAWFVWFLGSFRALPFTQASIAFGFLVLALISGGMFWLNRAQLVTYMRQHWRHILIVEAVGLALFGLMLFIRWGNPDLWHPNFGGEKPMDFSYFNAVLKSTYFPPYDPWLAGGYLNYYYYGFVVAGLLTKLLGVVPSLAYNLILPMLFSLVGVNAFCVAYNLVAASGTASHPARTLSPRGPLPRGEGDNGSEAGRASDIAARQDALGLPPISGEAGYGPAALSGDGRLPTETRQAPVAAADPPPVIQEDDFEWTVTETPPEPAAEALPIVISEQPTPVVASDVRPPTSRPAGPNPYLAGMAAALLIVVLGNLGQVRTYIVGFMKSADHAALAESALGDNDFTAAVNGAWRVLSGQTELQVGLGQWYWDATRIIPYVNGGGSEITEFPFFTFLYADPHAHLIVMPFTVLAIAWAVAYLLGHGRRRSRLESAALWLIGGLAIGVTRPSNTWDYPMYIALGAAAIVGAQWLKDPRLTRQNVIAVAGRLVLLAGLTLLLYRPFDQWVAVPLTDLKLWDGEKTPFESYLYIHGLFLFALVTFQVIETRRWLAETPATVLHRFGEWFSPLLLAILAFILSVAVFLYLGVRVAVIALPLMIWAGLLLLRGRDALPVGKRAVLFMLGTGLAVTVFVDVAVLGGDRMNTIFKLYMQVWMLFSISAAAALAWAWADLPRWTPNWRSGWSLALVALVGAAALYTVTAASAKMRDRFPDFAASPEGAGCQPIPGIPLPYDRGLPPDQQPHSLDGLDYMTWSAYCDSGYFLPLTYDYEAIRWMQDNVEGSPVIAEAQSFNLYRLSSRYAWYTGLPDVVGWDYHQRQQRGAAPTEFITQRGTQVSEFYATPDEGAAVDFLHEYDVRYIIVGPLERATYPPEGLAKFEQLTAAGLLSVAYHNPGVTIYRVDRLLAGN